MISIMWRTSRGDGWYHPFLDASYGQSVFKLCPTCMLIISPTLLLPAPSGQQYLDKDQWLGMYQSKCQFCIYFGFKESSHVLRGVSRHTKCTSHQSNQSHHHPSWKLKEVEEGHHLIKKLQLRWDDEDGDRCIFLPWNSSSWNLFQPGIWIDEDKLRHEEPKPKFYASLTSETWCALIELQIIVSEFRGGVSSSLRFSLIEFLNKQGDTTSPSLHPSLAESFPFSRARDLGLMAVLTSLSHHFYHNPLSLSA